MNRNNITYRLLTTLLQNVRDLTEVLLKHVQKAAVQAEQRLTEEALRRSEGKDPARESQPWPQGEANGPPECWLQLVRAGAPELLQVMETSEPGPKRTPEFFSPGPDAERAPDTFSTTVPAAPPKDVYRRNDRNPLSQEWDSACMPSPPLLRLPSRGVQLKKTLHTKSDSEIGATSEYLLSQRRPESLKMSHSTKKSKSTTRHATEANASLDDNGPGRVLTKASSSSIPSKPVEDNAATSLPNEKSSANGSRLPYAVKRSAHRFDPPQRASGATFFSNASQQMTAVRQVDSGASTTWGKPEKSPLSPFAKGGIVDSPSDRPPDRKTGTCEADPLHPTAADSFPETLWPELPSIAAGYAIEKPAWPYEAPGSAEDGWPELPSMQSLPRRQNEASWQEREWRHRCDLEQKGILWNG